MEGFEKLIICNVSGAIGVGKDTLLTVCLEGDRLKKKLGTDVDEVVVIYEPKELWDKLTWLTQFYADPKRIAYVFQQGVYFTAINNVRTHLNKVDKDKVTLFLVERGIFDQLCFWKAIFILFVKKYFIL
jgi:deoxyadenosine/deoxycytidine kinase